MDGWYQILSRIITYIINIVLDFNCVLRLLVNFNLFQLVDDGRLDILKNIKFVNWKIQDNMGDTLLHRIVKRIERTGLDVIKYQTLSFLLTVAPQLAFERNRRGETALCYACRRISPGIELKELLITFYPTEAINIPDKYGMTPLHYLVGHNFYVLLNKYIEYMPDYETSIIHDWENLIHKIIDKGADLNATDKDNVTPLVSSINYSICQNQHNYDTVIKILIQRGASLKVKNGFHAIVYVRSFKLALFMINHDPSELNIYNEHGVTPLHYVLSYVCSNYIDIIDLMFHPDGTLKIPNCDLIKICRDVKYKYKDIKMLVSKLPDYDVNTRDKEGNTLLIQYGFDLDSIEFFLKRGADISLKDNHGATVWVNATCIQDPDAIMALVKAGVNPSKEILILNIVLKKYCEYSNRNQERENWFTLFKTLYKHPKIQSIPNFDGYILQVIISGLNYITTYNLVRYSNVLRFLIQMNRYITKIVIEDEIPSVGGYVFNKALLDPLSLFLTRCNSLTRFCDPNSPNFPLEELVIILIEVGFTVTDSLPNSVSQLTALLTITQCPEYLERAIIRVAQRLLSIGVNVESQALEIVHIIHVDPERKVKIDALRRETFIPDAHLLAFLEDRKQVLNLVLLHFTSSPLTILYFDSRTYQNLETTRKFIRWFNTFSNLQDIDPGTKFFKYINELMDEWMDLYNANILNDNEQQELFAILLRFRKMKSSFPSLEDLCLYSIRLSVAEEATQPGTSLPAILKDITLKLYKRRQHWSTENNYEWRCKWRYLKQYYFSLRMKKNKSNKLLPSN